MEIKCEIRYCENVLYMYMQGKLNVNTNMIKANVLINNIAMSRPKSFTLHYLVNIMITKCSKNFSNYL